MMLAVYMAMGWKLLPCKPGTKEIDTDKQDAAYERYVSTMGSGPRGEGAAPNWAEVTKWNDESSNLSWAVQTGDESGIIVIDCDTDEGSLVIKGMLPEGFQVVGVSTVRGWHYYFKRPPFRVVNHESVPGVHVRCDDGAYAMLPPSVHPSGKVYEWLGGRVPSELPTMPDLLQGWVAENFAAPAGDDGYPGDYDFYDEYGNSYDDDDEDIEPDAVWRDEVWDCSMQNGEILVRSSELIWMQWPGQDVGEADCDVSEYRYKKTALTEEGLKFIEGLMIGSIPGEWRDIHWPIDEESSDTEKFIREGDWYEYVIDPGTESEIVHKQTENDIPF